MKTSITFIAILSALSACGVEQNKVKQDSTDIDSTLQVQVVDSVDAQKTLNDIRFDNWGEKEWLDNEYIRTLRKYLTDCANGKVDNPDLAPYKEQIKGKFVVYSTQPFLAGGAFIQIVFLDMPDRVFSCWIYSSVNEEEKTVESYEVRSVRLEEESIDMTKENILQAIKEMDGLKLW